MLVVQNECRPNAIAHALVDLMRGGVSCTRVCSAYMTLAGSRTLYDAVRRANVGNDANIPTTIVTSLDFGITEPEALRFWRGQANTHVFVAGAQMVERGSLRPATAFHPKLYLFDKENGEVASLVGSANLTNRGLTTNCEVVWADSHICASEVDIAWRAAVQPATLLTDSIFDQYKVLRRALPPVERRDEVSMPVPAPALVNTGEYGLFRDMAANENLGVYQQMWIQSASLQGGSHTQLELPRGAHRFFGLQFDDYESAHQTIGEPVLVSGAYRWEDRAIAWHGGNGMERINLPSVAIGGVNYKQSLILFRRVEPGVFELRAEPLDSDVANAIVAASQLTDSVFRVGTNTRRLAGLIRG